MESSDFTRLDYKTINEFFPKGQLSILAAGPGVGKTVFATQIANQFCRHGENTNGNVRCCITDIPRISLEDILLAIKKRYFNVIIIDYVELMDSIKTFDGINRAEELRAIWMSLDKLAKENDIRIIGVSQLIRIRIDGSEKALPNKCMNYLDKEFKRERIRILHREEYYSDCTVCDNLKPVDIITYGNDYSMIYPIKFIK